MPPLHGSKAKLLLSGYDVSSSMREGNAPVSIDLAETSTWGMTSKRYTSSDRIDGQFTGGGIWEASGIVPGSIDELLHTKLGGAHIASYLPQGDGFGFRAVFLGGIESAFEITSPGDDAVGFTFELQSAQGFVNKGRVLRALAGDNSISAGANGVSYDDLGAAGTTTTGLGAALHVKQKGGGAGTLTVRVQHSPDQSAWTDLIVFTGVTTAPGAQYLEVAGTVQRYLRTIWALTGGTWDFHVAAGRR
jgi:hypothetical protein